MKFFRSKGVEKSTYFIELDAAGLYVMCFFTKMSCHLYQLALLLAAALPGAYGHFTRTNLLHPNSIHNELEHHH